ncbi:MAG: hypothetical protein A2W19_14455 [Spirochaetes bacterium RBG_16_49_21]|nr:MAG: hypothetical protein A2W19_14455 [Spirochaetes bacterium RBG_16_49_21]
MTDSWVFIPGLALLFVLGMVIRNRLAREYRSRPGASIQTVALVWTFYAVHFSLVVFAAVKSTWRLILHPSLALGGGIVLAGVGVVLNLSAAYAFRSLKRLSGLDNARLVTEGIYRWSRNPQLLGWTLVLVGLGLIRESAMLILLALFFWVSYRLCLPLEEVLLERLFGKEYETYRRHTHRYFGPPRKRRKEWQS